MVTNHTTLLSLCLATAAIGLAPARASAAEWIEGSGERRFAGAVDVAARQFLDERADELGLRSIELAPGARLRTAGATTQRLEQRHRGLPVLGAAVAVRVSDDGRVRGAALGVARGLHVENDPSLQAQDAAAAVRAQTGAAPEQEPRLAVLPDEQGSGALVWVVDAPTRPGGERFLIDAHTGALRGRRPLALEARGRVYKIGVVQTPQPTDEPLPGLDASTPQRLNGHKGQMSVFEYASGGLQKQCTAQQSVAPSEGGDFLYDPPLLSTDLHDPFAAVNAYYHIDRIREFYTSELGVDMSSPSWALGVVVNARDNGAPLNNAFYTPMGLSSPKRPNLIAIGQGSFDFAYDSDVLLHEFTHYVSKNAIGDNGGQFASDAFGFSPFRAAIDEGVADYFACSLNGDPRLGEALLGSKARDLTDPDQHCPDRLIGEVHEDGKIIGTSGWKLRELLGAPLADQLMWGGFTMMVPGSSFGDFAAAVIETGNDLVKEKKMSKADLAQVRQVFADRGLDDCGRVLSLNKAPRDLPMLGLTVMGQFYESACAQAQEFLPLQSSFHFSYKPEPGAKRVRFEVSLKVIGAAGDLDWSIYVSKNHHVPFAPAANGFPHVGDVDFMEEGFVGATGSITLGAGTGNKLDPGATYYAVVVHKNCPFTVASLSAHSDDGKSPLPQDDSTQIPASKSSKSYVNRAIEPAPDAGAGGGASTSPGPTPVVSLIDTPRTSTTPGCGVAPGASPRGAAAALALCALAALRRAQARGLRTA